EDVRNGWVAQQWFERPQSERLVENLVDKALTLGQAQQIGTEPAKFFRGLPHFPAQLLFAHGADGRQVHAGDELLVQVLLVAKETLLSRRRLAVVSADVGS